jgi:hypothetical protein
MKNRLKQNAQPDCQKNRNKALMAISIVASSSIFATFVFIHTNFALANQSDSIDTIAKFAVNEDPDFKGQLETLIPPMTILGHQQLGARLGIYLNPYPPSKEDAVYRLEAVAALNRSREERNRLEMLLADLHNNFLNLRPIKAPPPEYIPLEKILPRGLENMRKFWPLMAELRRTVSKFRATPALRDLFWEGANLGSLIIDAGILEVYLAAAKMKGKDNTLALVALNDSESITRPNSFRWSRAGLPIPTAQLIPKENNPSGLLFCRLLNAQPSK